MQKNSTALARLPMRLPANHGAAVTESQGIFAMCKLKYDAAVER